MTTALKDASLAGTISYNGFTFGGDGSTPPSYSLSGEPVYDEAGRAVTHVKYSLEVTAIVHADSESSAADRMRDVRERLSRPGRALQILDVGLGDTTVAHGENQPDVVWGAKPRVVALTPIGGVLAWQLHWQCEFNVSEPNVASVSRNGGGDNWLALNYQMSYAVDSRGFTTRTARGYVQIVCVRRPNGDPSARRTADAARDRLKIAVPHGFRRTQSRWTESKDKSRLEFVVVDEQLRTDAFPPGIVDADVQYQVENQGVSNTQLVARLSGSMETAAHVPKSTAALQLLAIAQDKLFKLACSGGGRLVVPTRISISHKLFTRRTSLKVEMRSIGPLTDLLAAGGIWDPVPGTDYRRWRASVERLWGNRGTAELKSNPDDAAIIDLIDNLTDEATIGSGSAARLRPTSGGRLPTLAPPVTAAASWLDYQVRIRAHRRENVSIHTLSREVRPASPGQQSAAGVGSPFSLSGRDQTGRVRETHGEPIQQILLEGTAIRLQYPPTIPILRQVGSRTVTERDRVQQLQQAPNVCGMPAYLVRWSILYDVDGYVRRPEPPPNPTATSNSSN